MKTFTENLNVKTLLKYREYDRVNKPAPMLMFLEYNTVESLVEKIKKEGFNGAVELSVYQDQVLLTNGNHRISAVDILEYEKVPTEITIYETEEELNNMFLYSNHRKI